MTSTTEWVDYLNQFDLSYNYFQNIPSITEKYCVIIEPRQQPLLIKVIKNFIYLLQNKGWGLIIFHGIDNDNYVKTHLQGWKNVKYINLHVSNLSVNDYNHIMTNVNFWEKLKTLNCIHSLIFQCDTVLLKDNVNDFLNYDFIGAPWCIEWYNINGGYNGGLSLRNVNCMIHIIRNSNPITILETNLLANEDIFFAFYLDMFRNYCCLPDRDTAKTFSVETVYYENPTGMHQPHIEKFPNRDEFVRILSKRYKIE